MTSAVGVLGGRIDPFEVAVFLCFAVAFVWGTYNALDAWRNMAAVLRANQGQTTGRAVAVALDDLFRAVIKVILLALPGVGVGVLLMLFAPGDTVAEPLRYAVGLFLRFSYLCIALGVALVVASSFWLRRFLAQPDPLVSGDTATRLEAALQENTELTKAAGEKADAAYTVANTINEKIASLGEGLSAERAQERLVRELPPHEAAPDDFVSNR